MSTKENDVNAPVDGMEILDVEDGEDGSPEEFSFVEIYKMLVQNNDIILCIGPDDLEPLRKGLSSIKYQVNRKAKEAGEKVDDRTIEFEVLGDLQDPEQQPPGTIRVQVYLRARKGLTVHKIIIPEGF